MITVDLNEHGFDDCRLTSNKTELSGILPNYKDLRSLVKKGEQYILSRPLKNKIHPAYIVTEEICSGKYGRIYHAMRTDLTKTSHEYSDIVIKELAINVSKDEMKEKGKETATLNAIESNMFEGIIHALVHKMFETLGLYSIVPTLYEICARSKKDSILVPSDIECIDIMMEYIHGYTLQDYMTVYFTRIQNAALHDHMPESISKCRIRNEQLLLDILIQLACYLDVLQTNLRFNHRDLKINNILVRKTSSTRISSTIRKLIHPSLITPYECKNDIVIIDYGFSCIACSNTNKSCLEAGSYFKQGYECMKSGRDLALFLYSVNAIFPFVHHVSGPVYTLLQSLLVAVDSDGNTYNLLNGFDKDGNIRKHEKIEESVGEKGEFHEGIYLFLRRNDIEIPNCDPVFILDKLDKRGYVL